jgi:hypothetical protein
MPVVLPTTIDDARVPNAGAPTEKAEVAGTAGVPGAICPVGVAQVRTVPGVVGSEASGTGASVVSAVPGWVVAENGLGPLSAEVTIAPGVDGSPIAVLPMVETCARQALQPNSKAVAVNIRRRIALTSFQPMELAADLLVTNQLVFVAFLRTATLLPSVRLTIGLRMTWSPGLTPSCTSTSLPKSRAMVIFCR